jgi:hypothetical protein
MPIAGGLLRLGVNLLPFVERIRRHQRRHLSASRKAGAVTIISAFKKMSKTCDFLRMTWLAVSGGPRRDLTHPTPWLSCLDVVADFEHALNFRHGETVWHQRGSGRHRLEE